MLKILRLTSRFSKIDKRPPAVKKNVENKSKEDEKNKTQASPQEIQEDLPWEMSRVIINYVIPTAGVLGSWFNPWFIIPTSASLYLAQQNETRLTMNLPELKNKNLFRVIAWLIRLASVSTALAYFYVPQSIGMYFIPISSQVYAVLMMLAQHTLMKEHLSVLFQKMVARGGNTLFVLALCILLEQYLPKPTQDQIKSQQNSNQKDKQENVLETAQSVTNIKSEPEQTDKTIK